MTSLLFIAPSAYSFGGLATWLDYLVEGLEGLGWNITVALTKGQWHDVAGYRLKHAFNPVIEIVNKTGTREGRIQNICRAITQINPDLVVGVNIADAYEATWRIRRKKKISPKAVMTLHGIQPELYEDIKACRDMLDGVIGANQLSCALAEKYSKINPGKIHYAPCGVSMPPFKTKDRHEGPLRIIYVGRLEEEHNKRLQDIPKIIKRLNETEFHYEFTIAGTGQDEEKLKQSLKGETLSQKVRFLGYQEPGELVSKVYQYGDVLLLTSFTESGPFILWEALANGVAAVSSSYIGSGLEGSLRHEQNCLLFPIGDIEAAAQCLKKMQSCDLRSKLSKNGYQLVLERYSKSYSVTKWAEAFQKVLSTPICCPNNKASTRMQPSGRLDQILGIIMAENIRKVLNLHFDHRDAGGEWPHSYSGRKQDDQSFWELAKSLDSKNRSQDASAPFSNQPM